MRGCLRAFGTADSLLDPPRRRGGPLGRTGAKRVVVSSAGRVHSCLARRFSSLLVADQQVRLCWGACWRSPAALPQPRRRAATLKHPNQHRTDITPSTSVRFRPKSAAPSMRLAATHEHFTTLPDMATICTSSHCTSSICSAALHRFGVPRQVACTRCSR